jgi:dipeptidyl aminopeptidase/acylaminoacyl peptidase
VLDPQSGALAELGVDRVPGFRAAQLASDGRRLAYVGASPRHAAAVVLVDPATSEQEVIARSTADPDPRYISVPEAVEFPSAGGRTAHALFYRPHNEDYEAAEGEVPPLIVHIHGGPTAQAGADLHLDDQFWTSRGFALVTVNYGGSTGYGRPYRELLRGEWGVVDLEDCTEAALYLARTGEVDADRLAIAGGSAGGYTTLCALAFTDVFRAGASYFGVADVRALFTQTHKFESRYDEALIPPDKADERSPINAVDRITAAVIVFQGLDDKVVLPEQAEMIVEALAKRGVVHEYHAYEGEGHGFNKAESIVDSLESELRFYGRVFGFSPSSE